jgi:hypothetical protein
MGAELTVKLIGDIPARADERFAAMERDLRRMFAIGVREARRERSR